MIDNMSFNSVHGQEYMCDGVHVFTCAALMDSKRDLLLARAHSVGSSA